MSATEKWWWVSFPFPDFPDDTHIKSHLVPGSLLEAFLAEAKARWNTEPAEIKDVTGFEENAYMVDYGGMWVIDEPEVGAEVAGMTVSMKIHVFEAFVAGLAKSKERRFPTGEPYRKHHGWMSCIVLTPEQEDELHEKLAAQTLEVLAADDIFCDLLARRMQPLVDEGKIVAPKIPKRTIKPVDA